MTKYNYNKSIDIICESKSRRGGFKHESTLLINGSERDFQKVCYVNRTWERYTFETVINKLIESTERLTDKQKKAFRNKLERTNYCNA